MVKRGFFKGKEEKKVIRVGFLLLSPPIRVDK